MYPKNDITNIVESSHYVKIGNWCKMGYNKCKHTDWVKPYRCLGECAFRKRFTYSRVPLLGIQVLNQVTRLNSLLVRHLVVPHPSANLLSRLIPSLPFIPVQTLPRCHPQRLICPVCFAPALPVSPHVID